MEVLMGIFVKACVAVVVGVICLVGLILYSKKKDPGKRRRMGQLAKARRIPGI